jgi:Asp/Glu/hydantoin racemase
VDAFVIACFDDTGLDAARCAATAPVLGVGEVALHMASLIAAKFSVVTALSRSIAPIEHNLVRYGLAARCAGAMCPCSRQAPTRGAGSKRRSSVRSKRMAPRRSCSGAPA